MSTEFNKVKSGVIFTKAAQKQDLQSGDTIPEALGKLAKYMDVTDDALSNIQPILTFDSEPEYESLNPVTSGGLYDYIELQSPTYINTFSTESDLYSYSGNLTNNDYAFVGTGSGATYYMNVYQYKSEVIRDTIENIKTVPFGSNILKTLNEPTLPTGNIKYKLDCYVTAVNNQSYGTSPVITVIFSDNTTAQVTVPNASKTHIVKTYSKTIKSIQFMNSGQASDGYTDFEDIQILTTGGWNKLSYRLYNPTWDANQLSAINSGITSTKVTNYDNHIANKSNPHEVTKNQVGLGNVGNFKAVSTEASQVLTSAEQSNARTNINAQESLSFNGTYNASTNKVATESTVTNAINALDVSSQGGAGKYISEISETNGKVSATPTTMDTSLSNSSTNNNCPTSKTVYDDQQRQDAALAEVENKGAKNRCKITATTQTFRNVTFTVDAESGTITANGTANATDSIIISDIITTTEEMFLTGTPSGASGYNIRFGSASTYRDTGSGVSIPSGLSNSIYFAFNSGTVFSNVVLKPMICTKAEWDISQAYVPYGKTNAELTSDISALSTEINYAVNTGAKNLLNTDDYIKNSTGGLTITETGTGTYKITGTPSGTVDVFTTSSGTFNRMYGLQAGKTYTISGLPAGNGLLCRIDVSKNNSGSWDAQIISNLTLPQTFTVPSDATGLYIRYRITTSATIPSGGISLEPMIRPAAITDPTYVPYGKTNAELTAENTSQQAEINYAVNAGAKNLLKVSAADAKSNAGNAGFTWTGNTASKNHVNFKINGDLTVDVSSDTGYTASDLTIFYLTAGPAAYPNTILNGCPSGGSNTTYELRTATPIKSDYGSGVEITSDTATNVVIIIRSGWSGTLTFKPMLRPATITDNTFVPYAKTNRELTVENDSQQSEIDYAVNTGVKNLFQNKKNAGAIVVRNGATWSFDQTSMEAVVSGTVGSAWSDIYLLESSLDLSDKEYKIVIETDSSNLFMYIPGNTLSGGNIPANGQYYAGVYKYKGVMTTTTRFTAKTATYSGNSIRCMVCPASIIDSTFQPYALPNPVLTPAAIKAVDEGAKNIVNAPSGSGIRFINIPIVLQPGDYYVLFQNISSTDTDASTCQFAAFAENNSEASTFSQLARGNNTGSSFTVTKQTAYVRLYASNSYANGAGDTVTFTGCMICTATDYAVSQKFVPYALSNPILTPAAIKAVDEGAKNVLKITASSSSGNVNFTVNGDGTIAVNGTAGTSNVVFVVASGLTIPAGNYYISMFDNSAYYSDKMYISAQFKDTPSGSSTWSAHEYYTDTQINPAGNIQAVAIVVKAGQTISQTVQPMICAAADYAVSPKFVPYAPTNRELYETCETKVTMQQVYGDAIPIPANSDLNSYTTPGIYYALVADVPTIINTPYNATGLRFVVEKNTPSGAAVFQTIYPTSKGHLEFYRRIYEGGSWSSWYKFEGTKVTS